MSGSFEVSHLPDFWVQIVQLLILQVEHRYRTKPGKVQVNSHFSKVTSFFIELVCEELRIDKILILGSFTQDLFEKSACVLMKFYCSAKYMFKIWIYRSSKWISLIVCSINETAKNFCLFKNSQLICTKVYITTSIFSVSLARTP